MEKPSGIRIEVPEEYGSAYTNQADEREWVERRQRIGRGIYNALLELENIFDDADAFKQASKLLSQVFTDWSLSGDEGPLPKPWGNPAAFEALVESNMELTLWVLTIAYSRMSSLVQTEKN